MLDDISGKVDPQIIDVLSEIKNIADNLDIPFFIIGAIARDFILEHCHGVKSPRITQDIDLGAKIPDWERFKNLSEALLSTGKFSKTKDKHRIVCNDVYIDIVPFGPIADKDYRIKWPPENEIIMSTLGFEEAYESAITVRLSKQTQLEIKLPSIPGLALMKLLSWRDKYPERKKDAEDLFFIMKKYEYCGIETRLYEKEVSLLEEEGFDNCLAGIRLLGRDMAKMSNPVTLGKIKEILSDETADKTDYKLISGMISIHDDFVEALLMLEKLKQGVSEGH
jgi:predicted nucleotidyltransferase